MVCLWPISRSCIYVVRLAVCLNWVALDAVGEHESLRLIAYRVSTIVVK